MYQALGIQIWSNGVENQATTKKKTLENRQMIIVIRTDQEIKRVLKKKASRRK